MSEKTTKKNQPNGSVSRNGNGHKIKTNIRVSAEYSNDMRLALREEQKTELVLEIEEAVVHDVSGYVEFARSVLNTRTTSEKVVELQLKTAFGNDKYYQDWKKKNQLFFTALMDQPKTAGTGQPGAFFAPAASVNETDNNQSEANHEIFEEDELLNNLQEVGTVR